MVKPSLNCLKTNLYVVHISLIWFLSWPQLFVQADWKPESPDRFGDIAELVKSIGSLKVVETKPQGCSRLKFSSAVDCGFGF